tara:strand:+ start:1443 stop:2951 length:1509 start_codon:yes stop_codon:yes gene_type:complete
MAAMGAAQAGIEVLDDVGLPVPVTAWSMTSTPAGYRVVLQELHDPWQETWFVIRSDAGDRFNEIEIAVDGPAAGSPLLVRIEGARSIGSIVQTGNAETRIDHVAVHEDLGRVEAQSIGTLVAGRDITGPVIATTAANPMRGVVAVQAGRNITGSVLAQQGRIEFIDAGGRIGDPDDDVVIRARYGVGTIQTEAGAWIDLDLRTDEGTGRLWRLLSPRVAGRVFVDELAPGYGSDGTCRIETDVLEAELRIRTGLPGEEPIVRLGDAGLVGRILINTGDVGGVWSSPVHLGEPSQNSFTELHGPAYPAEPAAIGGGSVGVVPFRMHMAACEPVSGSSLPMPPASVLLRWYGPINWPEGPPVHIDRRTPPGEGGWEPAPAGHFLFLPVHGDPTALSVEGAAAELGFAAGWEYRLRPAATLVADLPDASHVAMDDVWTVVVDGAFTCPGDVDGDGTIAVSDLLVLLACWGEVDGPLARASDLDEDGTVGVLDLLVLISVWGACGG